jgi:hypothetical protein
VQDRLISAALTVIAVVSVGMIIAGNAALAAASEDEKGPAPTSDVRVVVQQD